MSDEKFPVNPTAAAATLRDLFACHVVAGLASARAGALQPASQKSRLDAISELAADAYAIADAMLQARPKAPAMGD